MNTQRTEMPKVKAIATLTMKIEKYDNQVFYETPKSWELWDTQPLHLVKRWSRKDVFWVIEEE